MKVFKIKNFIFKEYQSLDSNNFPFSHSNFFTANSEKSCKNSKPELAGNLKVLKTQSRFTEGNFYLNKTKNSTNNFDFSSSTYSKTMNKEKNQNFVV